MTKEELQKIFEEVASETNLQEIEALMLSDLEKYEGKPLKDVLPFFIAKSVSINQAFLFKILSKVLVDKQ